MGRIRLTEEEKRIKHLENSRRYCEENREKVNARKKEYRAKNKEKIVAYRKEYYASNKEKVLLGCKISKQKSKERISLYNKSYKEKNSEKIAEKRKLRNSLNKDKTNKYVRDRRANDIQYKIAQVGRGRRRRVLKAQSAKKQMSYEESLGCTVEFFKQYIESLWLPSMTWENYGLGKGKWCLDEIKPCAAFDLSDPEQYKACFHYTNCQPLWWVDNIKKSSWYEGKYHKHKK